MSIVLIREPLSDAEIGQLRSEFPFYEYHCLPRPLEPSDEVWAMTEVLYTDQLSSEELAKATQVSWIHVLQTALDSLPLPEIEQRGNILVTHTAEENTREAASFALAAILAFSKNFCGWYGASRQGRGVLDAKELMGHMFSLSRCSFVQIGLGKIGTAVIRLAEELDMRILGVSGKPSFHPGCHNVAPMSELQRALRHADVVCLCADREGGAPYSLTRTDIKAMKEGCILVVLGTESSIDQEALIDAADRFSGVLLDLKIKNGTASLNPQFAKLSHFLITPGVASYPAQAQGTGFRSFRYNMRQFTHENYSDMKGLVLGL